MLKNDIKKIKDWQKKNYIKRTYEFDIDFYNKFKEKCEQKNISQRSIIVKAIEDFMKQES